MPQALPAVGAWIMGSTAGAVVARIAITVAVGLLQANAQKRKMKRALANMGLDSGRSQMIRDPLAPRRLIYGEALVGGVVTFYYQKPGSDGYHYMVVTLAAHPVEAITQVRFNNLPFQNADGSEVTTSVVRIRKFLGKPEGERDLDWENEIPNYWGPQHLGKGVARLHIRLKWSENAWPNGLPEVSAVVKGAKVYDPRDTTQSPTNPANWKWHTNAALIAAHFLHVRKAVPYSRIDKAALITAANVCSEQVPLKTGGWEYRYTTNGLYTYDQNPLDALAELEDTFAGSIVDAGGRWTIHAGAWRSPVLELTDADIVSGFRCTPRASRQDTYNGVRGTFFNPKDEWAAADFPAVKNDTYRDWDGGVRLWKDTAYPYITSPAQAQRVAKIDLEKNRQQLAIEADFNARALRAQPGDIIQITRPRLGWVKKPFEVRTWQLKVEPTTGEDSTSGMALSVGITAVETAAEVYDWNDGDETTIDPAPNTGLIPQNYVAPPANFKLAQPSESETTDLPRIKATWNKSQDPLVVSGGKTELQFRKDTDSTWTHWSRLPGGLTHDYINDLSAYQKVHIRARHENINGVKSDWATASITPESVAPYLDLSHYAIGRRSQGGFYSEFLIIRSKTKGGAPYDGRYFVRLHVSTNPDVYHLHFFSPHNQTQHHFALNNNWGPVLHIEVSLYKKDTPNANGPPAIETKLVPVIKDGQDGLPGAPGAPGGGGGSGQQYSLMMFRSLWIIANGQNTIDTIPGGGSKPAGQNVPLNAPSSVFHAGFTYNFYQWAASDPAGSWIANPSSPNTTIAMHGNATVYANYHSYQHPPPGWGGGW